MEYKKILVPIDFSCISNKLFEQTIYFAKAFNAKLVFYHVIDERMLYSSFSEYVYPDFVTPVNVNTNVRDNWVDSSKKKMDEYICKYIDKKDNVDYSEVVEIGLPYLKIVEYAKEEDFDLIVIGSHGSSGIKHLLLGSVADHVSHHSQKPILIVKVEKDK